MRCLMNRQRIASFTIAIALTLTSLPLQTAAQAGSSAFTVDDLLDVTNVAIADLSDDGRWLAATSGSLRDRIGIDNHRFGDPTYIAPSLVDVWIIDTQTAKAQKLFQGKRQVRGLKWSPDGSRLALFVLKADVFEPIIWERAAGKFAAPTLPAGKQAADNAEIEWSADGSRLLFALRSEPWRKKTAERFQYETAGPVVVHSSKEPFLAWDDLRRMSSLRSLAAYDLIGFGSGIYFGKHHKTLLQFVETLPPVAQKRVFVFSTSGDGKMHHAALREQLVNKGFVIVDEFCCRGWDTVGPLKLFGGINKGRPDENDLAGARAFAQGLKNKM